MARGVQVSTNRRPTRWMMVVMVCLLGLAACGPAEVEARIQTGAMAIAAQEAIDQLNLVGYTVTQSDVQEADGSTAYILGLSDLLTAPNSLNADTQQALFDLPLLALRGAVLADPSVLRRVDTYLIAFRDSCNTVYELDARLMSRLVLRSWPNGDDLIDVTRQTTEQMRISQTGC